MSQTRTIVLFIVGLVVGVAVNAVVSYYHNQKLIAVLTAEIQAIKASRLTPEGIAQIAKDQAAIDALKKKR